jgi:5-methylcytosine-specific restriction endonuclease McrA
MDGPAPELAAGCARILGPVRVAELYLAGLSGAYRDRDGEAFQALSFTERQVVWDGEHDAAAAERAASERAAALKYAEEAFAEYAGFTEKYPGVDIGPLACAVGRDSRTGQWTGPPSPPPAGGLAAPGDRAYGWLCERLVITRCLRYECTDEELLHGRRYAHCERNKFRAKAFLWTRQDGRCGWCGKPLLVGLGYYPVRSDPRSALFPEIDHIVPRSRGGPYVPGNTQLVHRQCNQQKNTKMTPRAGELVAVFTLSGDMTPRPAGYRPGARSRGQCPECGQVVTGRRKYCPPGWTSLREHQPPSGMESCLSVYGFCKGSRRAVPMVLNR